MIDIIKLSDLQIDALKKFAGVSSGNAATALSQMLGKLVEVDTPDIRILLVEEVTKLMGEPAELVIGVYFKIFGDASGSIFVTFSRNDAKTLISILLGKKEKERSVFSPLEESVIKESANIIAGAYITALSGVLKKTLILSVPQFATDMLGSIIDFIQIDANQESKQILVMKIKFKEEKKTIKGNIFILPDKELINILLNVIEFEGAGIWKKKK